MNACVCVNVFFNFILELKFYFLNKNIFNLFIKNSSQNASNSTNKSINNSNQSSFKSTKSSSEASICSKSQPVKISCFLTSSTTSTSTANNNYNNNSIDHQINNNNSSRNNSLVNTGLGTANNNMLVNNNNNKNTNNGINNNSSLSSNQQQMSNLFSNQQLDSALDKNNNNLGSNQQQQCHKSASLKQQTSRFSLNEARLKQLDNYNCQQYHESATAAAKANNKETFSDRYGNIKQIDDEDEGEDLYYEISDNIENEYNEIEQHDKQRLDDNEEVEEAERKRLSLMPNDDLIGGGGGDEMTKPRSEKLGKRSKLLGMLHGKSDHHHHHHQNNRHTPIPCKLVETSEAQLPPLPRYECAASPTTTISNNSNDFDRNLHLRRSKRYVRQSSAANMSLASIATSSSSPQQQHQSIAEEADQQTRSSLGQLGSNLIKALSTPSIVNKLKRELANEKQQQQQPSRLATALNDCAEMNNDDVDDDQKMIRSRANSITTSSSIQMYCKSSSDYKKLSDKYSKNEKKLLQNGNIFVDHYSLFFFGYKFKLFYFLEKKLFKYYKRSDSYSAAAR